MPKIVVHGATLKCSFGLSPGKLTVPPSNQVEGIELPVGTIQEFAPMVNIGTFGNCTAPSNPQVVAAQGAPVPCVPVIPAPWVEGSQTVTVNGLPVLTESSQCACTWSGKIEVSIAGQDDVEVDG